MKSKRSKGSCQKPARRQRFVWLRSTPFAFLLDCIEFLADVAVDFFTD